MKLHGKTAIVTGAASGIGRATCMKFAAEGARVACVDINADGAWQTERDIRNGGGEALHAVLDVSDEQRVSQTVGELLATVGSVNILANVAGGNCEGDLSRLDSKAWEACLAVNLTSFFLMTQALWHQFVEQRSGIILNTSSIMGQLGGANSIAYCCAKAAIITMTKCLAIDGAPHGIRANCVCPGFVDTPIMDSEFVKHGPGDAAKERLLSKLPFGRMATAEDIAHGFVFLASDDASYINGETLTIDGGVSLGLNI